MLALGVICVVVFQTQLGLGGAQTALESAICASLKRALMQNSLIAAELKERTEDTAFAVESAKLVLQAAKMKPMH